MTIVVEDGTGKSNAVSYASATVADTYWAAEADDVWGGLSVAEKEAALVKATREIERLYATRFVGTRVTLEQALSWPRDSAISADGLNLIACVPQQVIAATVELAKTAVTEDLRATDNPADVVSDTIKVGPIEISTGYSSGRADARVRTSLLLAPVITGAATLRVRRT